MFKLMQLAALLLLTIAAHEHFLGKREVISRQEGLSPIKVE